jgi:hypothetical protein
MHSRKNIKFSYWRQAVFVRDNIYWRLRRKEHVTSTGKKTYTRMQHIRSGIRPYVLAGRIWDKGIKINFSNYDFK